MQSALELADFLKTLGHIAHDRHDRDYRIGTVSQR
jgi:hypothetical protein